MNVLRRSIEITTPKRTLKTLALNVPCFGESGDLPRQGLREPLKFVALVEEISPPSGGRTP